MIVEAPNVHSAAWTYEDIKNINDDKRREIFNGSIYEMPSPSLLHQAIYRALVRLVENWIAAGGHGILYLQPVDLVLSDGTVFIPDLSFYQTNDKASVESADQSHLVAPPDLIIEILSPSTAARDRVTKYHAYAEFGVRHYWIVDPEAQTFHAFILENGHYHDEAVLRSGNEFRPILFPGLTLALDTLFQIA